MDFHVDMNAAGCSATDSQKRLLGSGSGKPIDFRAPSSLGRVYPTDKGQTSISWFSIQHIRRILVGLWDRVFYLLLEVGFAQASCV